MSERRLAKRFEICTPLSGWSAGLGYFQGQVRNLSATGAYILADHAVKENEQFVMLLKVPELYADGDISLLWASCRAIRVEMARDAERAWVGIAAVVEEYVMPSRRLDAGSGAEARKNHELVAA